MPHEEATEDQRLSQMISNILETFSIFCLLSATGAKQMFYFC